MPSLLNILASLCPNVPTQCPIMVLQYLNGPSHVLLLNHCVSLCHHYVLFSLTGSYSFISFIFFHHCGLLFCQRFLFFCHLIILCQICVLLCHYCTSLTHNTFLFCHHHGLFYFICAPLSELSQCPIMSLQWHIVSSVFFIVPSLCPIVPIQYPHVASQCPLVQSLWPIVLSKFLVKSSQCQLFIIKFYADIPVCLLYHHWAITSLYPAEASRCSIVSSLWPNVKVIMS